MKKNDLQLITNDTNKLTKDLIEALFDAIAEKNPYALDISKFYSDPNYQMCEDIIKVYSEAIWYGVNQAISNPVVIKELTNKAKQMGLNKLKFDINEFNKKVINDYLLNFSNFKECKGLKQSIQYVYDMIVRSGLQADLNIEGETGFNLKYGTEENPDEPFFLRVEGLLNPILYEGSVKTIAHPVGFGYFYVINLFLNFMEYVDDKVTFNIKKLNVKSATKTIDLSDKTVVDIIVSKNTQNQEQIIIRFSDGTELHKNYNGLITWYEADMSIKEQWDNSYRLNLDYNMELSFILKDEIDIPLAENIFYDCVWNKYEDFLRIGYFYVGQVYPKIVGGNVHLTETEYYITINDINHGTKFPQIEGNPHIYGYDEADEYVTETVKLGILNGFVKDQFQVDTNYHWVDEVEDKNIRVIGDEELIIGQFTLSNVDVKSVIYRDSFRCEIIPAN